MAMGHKLKRTKKASDVKVKMITVTPNYDAMQRQFARQALERMESFAHGEAFVSYEHLYSFVAALRITLLCLDTTCDASKKAMLEFRNSFDSAAEKMLGRLNQLRAEREAPATIEHYRSMRG